MLEGEYLNWSDVAIPARIASFYKVWPLEIQSEATKVTVKGPDM